MCPREAGPCVQTGVSPQSLDPGPGGVEGGGGLGVEPLYLLILSDLGDNYRNFTGLAGEANVSSGEARDGGVAPHGCPLLLFRQDLFQPRT